MSVIGSLNSTLPPSSWTCFIDGYPLISNNISNTSEICSLSNIVIKTTSTPSNLTLLASGTTKVSFLLDYIQYAPVASTVLDNATVLVDAFDTEIQYLNDSGEWITSGDQVKTSVRSLRASNISFNNFDLG